MPVNAKDNFVVRILSSAYTNDHMSIFGYKGTNFNIPLDQGGSQTSSWGSDVGRQRGTGIIVNHHGDMIDLEAIDNSRLPTSVVRIVKRVLNYLSVLHPLFVVKIPFPMSR